MYLKSIEVQGFKSFAHKMTFAFHNGITGIVGPNGSGKSNVADAVRWVLGEQSAKQLRGGQMQDVIFAGTEVRKPQSFATVAITLDNTDHQLDIDYDEVTVTRRLYRSGESEYLLNGANVRLRDINELFYDTGIGKEGYSIIGQGRIDQIISGKSEERRELFDEAAGIVKFKRRKATAIKKLDHERQNLLRVNDILNEISGRIEPLRIQSEKAKEYLEFKRVLRSLDVNLFLMETGHVQEEVTSIDENLRITSDHMQERRDAFARTKSEYEEIEKGLEEIEFEVAKLHQMEESNNLTMQQLHGHLDLLNEQIRGITQENVRSRERTDLLRREIEIRKEQLAENQKEKEDLQHRLEEITKTRTEKETALRETEIALDQHQRESDEAKNEIIHLLDSRASLKGKMQRYDTLREQIDIRSAEIARREIELSDGERDAKRRLEEAKTQKEESAAKVQMLTHTLEEAEEKAEENRKTLVSSSESLEKESEQYHLLSSRLSSLKDITERYEGYGNAIQTVMGKKDRVSGIYGVVADLLTVDEEYEVAIETALEGSIRNVVTDTQSTAKQMIEELKKEKAGRATFLPLDALTVRNKVSDLSILQDPGIIDVASNLVKVKEEYSILPDYLLGRVYVAKTMDDAIRINNTHEQSLFIVTLAGEYVKPGGSISGGAFKGRENLLGRRREIESLEKQVKERRAKIDALRDAIAIARAERNAQQETAKSARDMLQEETIRLHTAQMTYEQAEESSKEIAVLRETLDQEKAELGSQIRDVEGESKDATDALATSEQEERSLQDKVTLLGTQVEELEKTRDEQAQTLEEVHLKETEWSQTLRFMEETMNRLSGEEEAFVKEQEMILAGMTGNESEIASKEQEVVETKEEMDRIRKSNEEGAAHALTLLAQKEQMKEEHKGFFEKRDALSQEIAELDKEVFRLSQRKERLLESIEHQTNFLWEEYELTPVEAEKEKDDTLGTREEIKKSTGQIRASIRRLGDVHVGAIEEYKETSERYTFLKTQHDDLIKSEESLLKIIDELDAGMRRQFAEQFEKINASFDVVFKELFGGGTGSVTLEEGVDVLEANIAINAQPPGKKLQNMLQLSGGEKSLAAIALLFAIQSLKPSPFCLLDEIEASLDEANVTRFTRYLHRLTENTQFIVITHRRGTMAAADRLYGITMQEKGVSALVSVNLVSEELDD